MQLTPRKSLGQHFLTSRKALQEIIDSASIKPGEIILEIGPGTGILTQSLLQTKASKIIAIEKDDRAFALLKEKFQRDIQIGKLHLIRGDILELDLKSGEFQQNLLEDKHYSIIANIPYYITGAILEKFLEYSPRPKQMVLLVQKEVAERIITRDEKESILSISVKAFGLPRIIAKVPRGAFNPPPKVDSAILSIQNVTDQKFQDNSIDTRKFFQIVRAGFAHKRKYLINNLSEFAETETLHSIWNKLELDPNIRAEKLPVEKWFEIVSSISTITQVKILQ